MPVKGTYFLCINVSRDIGVTVGALGEIIFKKGKYVYVGSALNSLIPRLDRHLKHSRGKHDVTHWHIDYLLKDASVSISHILMNDNGEKIECEMASMASRHGESIPRFGCSDCRCVSHLYRVESFDFLEKTGYKKYG